LVESFGRDRLQVDTRMDPTPGMAEEGAFQMNPERLRASGISADFTVRALRRPGQILERLQRLLQRGGNRGRTVTGDAVPHHQSLDGRQTLIGAFHNVVPRASVNMHVNQPRRQDGIAEVHNSPPRRNRHGISPAYGGYDSAVHHECGILDALKRSQQLPG
jgi:hypothetical protein